MAALDFAEPIRIAEAYAFDDVLMLPAYSTVLPGQTDTRTRLTREISLHIPLIAAAMDTVTEAPMAIAMAQRGGIGVIHKNMTPAEQAEQIRQVKRFESGMVVNPITITPDAPLAEAQALMRLHSISGIPVVETGGRLVGILTHRDVRFATDPGQRVAELMTRERLITVTENVQQDEAKRELDDGGGVLEKLVLRDAPAIEEQERRQEQQEEHFRVEHHGHQARLVEQRAQRNLNERCRQPGH
eukprot:gene45019-55072_t